MKKIFAVIISIILLLNICEYICLAESDQTQYPQDRLSTSVQLLTTLGIINVSEESMLDTIARTDFAVYIARLLKINEFNSDDKLYYVDVPKDHWALSSINVLTEMGAFKVGSDACFRPDDTITLDEAIKVLITITGYQSYAEAKGGYPFGYLTVAKESNLLNGVAARGGLNRSDVILLLYNTAKIDILNVSKISEGYSTYYKKSGKTLFSKYWDAYDFEGVVSSIWGLSLANSNSIGENEVIINNILFKINLDINTYKYLGYSVQVWYRQKDSGDIGEIIYISEKQKKNNMITINADDLISVDDNNVLRYYDKDQSDKQSQVNLDAGITVIRNGVVIQYGLRDAFHIDKGEIRLIDSEDDGRYETVIVEQVENFVVGYVDKEQEIIYDKVKTGCLINLKNTSGKIVKIFSANGSKLALNRISELDVLSVIRTDEQYIDIYVCPESVEGTIQEITEENGKIGLSVNGKSYDIDPTYLAESGFYPQDPVTGQKVFKLKNGDSYIFKMDKYGYIAYISTAAKNDMVFGYIICAALSKGVDQTLEIKIFSQDGSVSVLKCEKKVNFDGESISSVSALLKALKDGMPQLIRYQTNEEGNITSIDTAEKKEKESEQSLTMTTVFQNMRYVWGPRCFGTKTIIDENTIIMKIPDKNVTTSQAYSFKLSNLGMFVADGNYKIQTYKTIKDSPYEQVLLVTYDPDSAVDLTSAEVILVDKITSALNEDGTPVKKISGYQRYTLVELYVMDTFNEVTDIVNYSNDNQINSISDIGSGDVIRAGQNSKGEINVIELLYDYSSHTVPKWAPMRDGLFAHGRLSFAYCSDKKGTVLEWSDTPGGEVTGLQNINSIYGPATVEIYDSSKKQGQISIGSINDILSFDTVGNACSYMVISVDFMTVKNVIVYR